MENDQAALDSPLSTLLQEEYYLTKILGHLLDDGLHECRLVCRRWYDICNRLPLKLNIPFEKIPLVVDKFPKAVAVSIRGLERGEWKEEDTRVVESLMQMRHLEKLSLGATFGFPSGFIMYPICDPLGEAIQSLRRLQSLDLLWIDAELVDFIWPRIRYLTGLRRLRAYSSRIYPVLEPFTELRSIEDLDAPRFLTNQKGQLRFPSLTHLTRLYVREDEVSFGRFRGGILQMILPYAASLRSLIVDSVGFNNTIRNQWPLIRKFRQLSSLQVLASTNGTNPVSFSELNYLNELAHLRFLIHMRPSNVLEALVTEKFLTNLRSLDLSVSRSDNEHISKLFASTSHLTNLVFRHLDATEPLSFLTALRVLNLQVKASSLVDFSEAFRHLQDLESVMLFGNMCSLSARDFCSLKNLRSLKLCTFTLDGDFFGELAELSTLTKLGVYESDIPSHSTLFGINVLTNLERLELEDIERPDLDPIRVLTEGKLSRLRYLSITTKRTDVPELYQSLPSLRKCFLESPMLF